jgi:hypothetical protein
MACVIFRAVTSKDIPTSDIDEKINVPAGEK